MANDEIERKMEFIVQQQAQFASDVVEMRQFQSETWKMLRQTVQVVDLMSITVREGFKTVVERQDESIKDRRELREDQEEVKAGLSDVNAKIDALVDAQIRTDEQQKLTADQLQRTHEEQQRTEKGLQRTHEEQQRTEKELQRTERLVARNAIEIRRTNQAVRLTTRNLNTLTKLVNQRSNKKGN